MGHRFYIGNGIASRLSGGDYNVQGVCASIQADSMDIARGLFVEWALEKNPGFSIGGVTLRDVTDEVLAFAAARERSEHSSPRQVEREGSRDEPQPPSRDDAGGGG